ncbi:hypothetical protein Fmac_026020 [Flemingia macrophylla]|uniref:SANTA domain-containing protein n=1 Tax=Flemingia macrophylla TaxID=520843 RepID=A0ABD1LDP3_9FABA
MAGGNSSNTIPVPPNSRIFLHEWWLVKQPKGLAVGGVSSVGRNRERVFLSTVIAEREEANVLHTQDGITILFRGFINNSRSTQNGVPAEVCQHFLVGFPHDWKKFSAHSFGDKDVDGVYAFGDSSACSKKKDEDAFPFSMGGNDFTKRHSSILSNNCLAPIKVCDGLGICLGNGSKQSESTDNHNTEVNLNSSHDEMHNGEKGISHIAVGSQTGHSKNVQSSMGMHAFNMYTGPSGTSTVKPPTSTKKIKKDQFSSELKEKQCVRQNNSCSRMVTRSISKNSHTMPNDGKAKVASFVSPVRRSRRLYSCS